MQTPVYWGKHNKMKIERKLQARICEQMLESLDKIDRNALFGCEESEEGFVLGAGFLTELFEARRKFFACEHKNTFDPNQYTEKDRVYWCVDCGALCIVSSGEWLIPGSNEYAKRVQRNDTETL